VLTITPQSIKYIAVGICAVQALCYLYIALKDGWMPTLIDGIDTKE